MLCSFYTPDVWEDDQADEWRVKRKRPDLVCKLVLKRRQTMGMLRIMSRRGDERVVWDNEKVDSNDLEAVAAIREAERIFSQERARGATAFKVESGKPVERIEQFDRTAEQIVMVPRVVGG
jgi:hypothetical protein